MSAITLEQTTTSSTVLDEIEKKLIVDGTISEDPVRIYVNRLTPPIGTSFFHKESITIFDNKQITGGNGLLETVAWRTDVYKYATGARPDAPDFRAKGGEIYIIMVHGGTGHAESPSLFHEYARRVKAPSSITPVKQYPASHSGIQSDDKWSYNINYSNTMPMFNNGGNGVFDFEAGYQEDFVRYRSQQTGFETGNSVEFAVKPATVPPMSPDYSIIGLSVFKCLDPSAFPARFNFEARASNIASVGDDGSINRDVTIGFDFTP
ncbi:hypothetical protein EYR40_003313 [Pleurotus pulmonarius]|nr:hypothetical protein EYR40_003313 [Pleurotus pulmonarius]KAF4606040.1 hypothetical protein EYR38_000085 [Pleurotus pulmonarius]